MAGLVRGPGVMEDFREAGGDHVAAPAVKIVPAAIALAAESFLILAAWVGAEQHTTRFQGRSQFPQNPWQFPMGQGAQPCLEAMGTICQRIETPDEVLPAAEAAVNMAYRSDQSVALLLSQRLIGAKPF